jgi:hypothetical protein
MICLLGPPSRQAGNELAGRRVGGTFCEIHCITVIAASWQTELDDPVPDSDGTYLTQPTAPLRTHARRAKSAPVA